MCFVDFIYHKPKDYIAFDIYGMKEVIRNASFVFIFENTFMVMEHELNLTKTEQEST